MAELILGVGCRRGVTLERLQATLARFLRENGIARQEISLLASCTLKSDEEGLLALARWLQVETVFFSQGELNRVAVPNPSAVVNRKIGTFSVAEAAAIRAGGGQLLVPKHKYEDVTFALAR